MAAERPRFVLTYDPLDPADALAAVASDEAGATVSFLGTVRAASRGRAVVRLEYEAYDSMALAVFAAIASEARERWPGCQVAVHHRLGACAAGEPTVAISASAPHRAAAFEACRHVIERLKADAPIWKREVYADGEAWVGQGS